MRSPSYDDLREARPRATAALDAVVDHPRAAAIIAVILDEFDDDYIDKIAVAVNRGTLDLSWDDTGNTPTFDLTDKYWRYYERLIFGEILPDE